MKAMKVFNFEHYSIEVGTYVWSDHGDVQLAVKVKDSSGEVKLSGIESIHDGDGQIEIAKEDDFGGRTSCWTDTRSYWRDEDYDFERIAKELAARIDLNCWATAAVRGFAHYSHPLPQFVYDPNDFPTHY